MRRPIKSGVSFSRGAKYVAPELNALTTEEAKLLLEQGNQHALELLNLLQPLKTIRLAWLFSPGALARVLAQKWRQLKIPTLRQRSTQSSFKC